jgi:hypothetical protein
MLATAKPAVTATAPTPKLSGFRIPLLLSTSQAATAPVVTGPRTCTVDVPEIGIPAGPLEPSNGGTAARRALGGRLRP